MLGARTSALEFEGVGAQVNPNASQAHAAGGRQEPLQPGLMCSHYHKGATWQADPPVPPGAPGTPLPFPAATLVPAVGLSPDVYFDEGKSMNMCGGGGEAVFKIKFKSLLR